MNKAPNKLSAFNYTKPGVILGFLLAGVMLAIGIWSYKVNVEKHDPLLTTCTVVTMGIGLSSLAVETYRFWKMKKMH